MEKRLKLIAFYDLLNVKFQRRFILSATTKLDYMISVLNRMGYSVDIISPAVAEGGMLALSKTETKQLGVNTLTTFGCISLPSKRLTRKVSGRQVFKKFKKYLFNTIKDGDYVIAYHSPRYAKTLADLRNERNFILIGEVEEIYQDVRSMGQAFNTQEYDFFEACDRFIFPTHLLDNKLNASNNKKSITIHGLYNAEPDRNVKFNDNKIHVVYAGTFDPQKGGAAAAVAATAFLPENYHIHICGFGNHAATEKIKEAIREIQNTAKATVSFDGMLKGEDFFQFIQKCEIGLSTQNPDAAFNATSFPSKVLNYLSNGLKVVTIDIPAVRHSSVGNHLFYYQKQTPEEIAAAIIEAHTNEGFNGRALLRSLDVKFEKDLEYLLK